MMDYINFIIIIIGILITDPINAAITTCTNDTPVLGLLYNKYCGDTQFCCNKAEKVCCNNGEVCSGSACLNIGGIVGGCIAFVIGVSVTVVVICCICRRRKQQPGVIQCRPGQSITMNTYNQTASVPQTQQYPQTGHVGNNQPQPAGWGSDLPPKYS